jgi:hypothetical protein
MDEHRICAICGAPLPWQDYLSAKRNNTSGSWTPMQTRTFSIGDATIAPGSTYQRKRPARTASIESDVVVPGLQATITGILAGALVAGIAIMRRSEFSAMIGLIGCAATWGVSWLWLLHEHRQLLWEVESIIGADLNGDGEIGAPPAPPTTVRVDITDKPASTETHLNFFELPINQRKMAEVARLIMNGVSFSEDKIAGKNCPLSGPRFRELQDILLSRKMLRWRNEENHRLGVEITRGGQAMFRAFAGDPPTPPNAADSNSVGTVRTYAVRTDDITMGREAT